MQTKEQKPMKVMCFYMLSSVIIFQRGTLLIYKSLRKLDLISWKTVYTWKRHGVLWSLELDTWTLAPPLAQWRLISSASYLFIIWLNAFEAFKQLIRSKTLHMQASVNVRTYIQRQRLIFHISLRIRKRVTQINCPKTKVAHFNAAVAFP